MASILVAPSEGSTKVVFDVTTRCSLHLLTLLWLNTLELRHDDLCWLPNYVC